jgi:hypothetical protein
MPPRMDTPPHLHPAVLIPLHSSSGVFSLAPPPPLIHSLCQSVHTNVASDNSGSPSQCEGNCKCLIWEHRRLRRNTAQEDASDVIPTTRGLVSIALVYFSVQKSSQLAAMQIHKIIRMNTLCLTNQTLCYEGTWGSGGIVPSFSSSALNRRDY